MAALVEKASHVRTQLGLPGDLPLHKVVEEAVEQLGLGARVEGQTLVQKMDACLDALGVSASAPPGTPITETPVVMGEVVEAVAVGTPPVAPPVSQHMAREGAAGRGAEQAAGHRRYADPPNNARPIHPENDNFFWRYYKPNDEACPCEYEACCKAILMPACVHGEINAWANGTDKTCEWIMCGGLFGLCMIEGDRNEVERKIHEFHRARGDPRAQRPPVKAGEGVVCVGLLCGPVAAIIMHAQNYWVMKRFQEVQAPYL